MAVLTCLVYYLCVYVLFAQVSTTYAQKKKVDIASPIAAPKIAQDNFEITEGPLPIGKIAQDNFEITEGPLPIGKIAQDNFEITEGPITTKPPITTTAPITTTPPKTTTSTITKTPSITTTSTITTTSSIATTSTIITTQPKTTTSPITTTPSIATTSSITTTSPITTTSSIATTSPISTTSSITTTSPITTTRPITTTPLITTTPPITTIKPMVEETAKTTPSSYINTNQIPQDKFILTTISSPAVPLKPTSPPETTSVNSVLPHQVTTTTSPTIRQIDTVPSTDVIEGVTVTVPLQQAFTMAPPPEPLIARVEYPLLRTAIMHVTEPPPQAMIARVELPLLRTAIMHVTEPPPQAMIALVEPPQAMIARVDYPILRTAIMHVTEPPPQAMIARVEPPQAMIARVDYPILRTAIMHVTEPPPQAMIARVEPPQAMIARVDYPILRTAIMHVTEPPQDLAMIARVDSSLLRTAIMRVTYPPPAVMDISLARSSNMALSESLDLASNSSNSVTSSVSQALSTASQSTTADAKTGLQHHQLGFLLETVLADYDPRLRPRNDQSRFVSIFSDFVPINIIEFDTQQQKFSVMGYFKMDWRDDFLTWTPSMYEDAETLRIPSKSIWIPKLVIAKAYDGNGLVGDKESDIALIHHLGYVRWFPEGTYSLVCKVTIQFYPFDIQTCTLTYYIADEDNSTINLRHGGEVDLSEYIENAEWKLVSLTTERKLVDNIYVVNFYFNVERRGGFAMFTLVVPILLLAMLSGATFLIPIESGEKCSFSVTIFLAYGIFETIVIDTLPHNSLDVSYFIIYLTSLLIISVLLTFYTILQAKILETMGDKVFKCLSGTNSGSLTWGLFLQKLDTYAFVLFLVLVVGFTSTFFAVMSEKLNIV